MVPHSGSRFSAAVRSGIGRAGQGISALLTMRLNRPVVWAWVVWINDLFRLLWVCRVSVASVLIGTALVIFAVQARDLFIFAPSGRVPETPSTIYRPFEMLGSSRNTASLFFIETVMWLRILRHALALAATIFLFWALPVFFAARLSLRHGLWLLPASGISVVADGTSGLIEIRKRLHGLTQFVPRALGAACFLVVLYALFSLLQEMYEPDANRSTVLALRQIYTSIFVVVATLALFVFFVSRRRSLYDSTLGKLTGEKLTAEDPGEILGPGAVSRQGTKSATDSPSTHKLNFLLPDRSVAHLIGLGTFWLLGAALVWLYFFPERRFYFDRDLLFPLLLGAWVPPLYALSYISYRVRLPMILIVFAASMAITYFAGDNHAIPFRPLPHQHADAPPPGRQWQIDEAIGIWARANDCFDTVTGRPGPDCPRPVIVAAEGGASRAAFMTATVLGTLLDATCEQPRQFYNQPCPTTPAIVRRLFAISSVSGGAVGAGVFSAALDLALQNGRKTGIFKHPCDELAYSPLVFHPSAPRHWRDCLQILTAGDFLSPVATGLFIRDNAFLLRLQPDRQSLLESAWSSHFAYATGSDEQSGLRSAFSVLGPREKDWRPLLVLNGTSSATGRRIVTSHLAPEPPRYALAPVEGGSRLFRDSYDAHEMFAKAGKPDPGQQPACVAFIDDEAPISKIENRDFTLASAISNSARFPIVSPPGDISCVGPQGSRNVIDRVVDGGYFDNLGATSAIDIATALIGFHLDPVVLLITNEPTNAVEADRLITPRSTPSLPDETDPPFLSPVRTPFAALYATRLARGSYSMDLLADQIARNAAARVKHSSKAAPATNRRVYHIAIHGEHLNFKPDVREECENTLASGNPAPKHCTTPTKPVSMSWWLSRPVQDFIDGQLPGPGAQKFKLPEKVANIIRARVRNHTELLGFCSTIDALEACKESLGGDPAKLSVVQP